MDTIQLVKNLELKLLTRIDNLKDELMSIRTNRPSSKLVEKIQVDAYGQKMTVAQLSTITVVPPREINIMVWDMEVLKSVAKAIESSPLGVNPSIDGALIRINLPSLTEERKKELIKVVRSIVEESKIRVRSHRDDANKKIKDASHDKTINEDQVFKTKEKIQKIIDDMNNNIDNLLEQKIKEIES